MEGAAVLFKLHADLLVLVLEPAPVPAVGDGERALRRAPERRRAEDAQGVRRAFSAETAEGSRKLVVHTADANAERGAVSADGMAVADTVIVQVFVGEGQS